MCVYLVNEPVLVPHCQVFGCSVDMSAHVSGSGTLLLVVLAPVDEGQLLQHRREETRLQHRCYYLNVVLTAQDRIAFAKHLLQCICIGGGGHYMEWWALYGVVGTIWSGGHYME